MRRKELYPSEDHMLSRAISLCLNMYGEKTSILVQKFPVEYLHLKYSRVLFISESPLQVQRARASYRDEQQLAEKLRQEMRAAQNDSQRQVRDHSNCILNLLYSWATGNSL